ncbi:MAG: SRPBCC domain-containing protein [Pseudomonadota bacterium]|nr:SRPBCC domain-containing protein [Pseudomonadota bacterium]
MLKKTADLAGSELVLTRTFSAPRSLVWEAWTDPEHLSQWMGPREHPACSYECDLRVGGAWRARLRAADGGPDLTVGGVYREIVPAERLVFTFVWDEPHAAHGHNTLVTISLADKGDGTEMTLRQQFLPSIEERDGHAHGWSSSFDRLAEHLDNSQSRA